jgi:hypothetical protein
MKIDSSVNKLIGGTVAGVGSIFLAYEGIIPPEAVTAILGSLVAYFVGESNGKKKVEN